jgi:formamidopyrimidine-DNA glycosylase
MEELWEQRWGKLGADGLTITAGQLHEKLKRTGRAVKAALLDQTVVAGLGNIYVDELLFACGIGPGRRAETLGQKEVGAMVRRMRVLLGQAIEARGSSTRDYVDGRGRSGGFQLRHRVYGRRGLACMGCAGMLSSGVVAGRTTVWCPVCQGE